MHSDYPCMIYFYKFAALFLFQSYLIHNSQKIASKNRPAKRKNGRILNNTSDKNDENECRQNIPEIRFDPCREFHAVTGIHFFQVLIKSPPVFRNAEEGKYERSERQNKVADNKVLTVKNAPCSDNLYVFPKAESEYAGNASEKDQRE